MLCMSLFFFKPKTAYEMRISDWSSEVCSSDLRYIVADEIPITGFGVELDRKAAHVTRRVDRSGAAGDGREANEDRTTRPFLLEDRHLGQFGNRPGAFEHTVRARPARLDDAFGNALMVEMEDFTAEGEILETGRTVCR